MERTPDLALGKRTIGGSLNGVAGFADDHGPSYHDLAQRVRSLEEAVARRERVFQRLIDVFSGFNANRG